MDSASNGFVLRFAGWFAAQGEKPIRVSIDRDNEPLESFVPFSRADLSAAHPQDDPELLGGFEGTVLITGIKGELTLAIKAHFASQAQCVATVVLAVIPLEPTFCAGARRC